MDRPALGEYVAPRSIGFKLLGKLIGRPSNAQGGWVGVCGWGAFPGNFLANNRIRYTINCTLPSIRILWETRPLLTYVGGGADGVGFV